MMKSGFVVETIIENCSCNLPTHRLLKCDQDLFEAQTEDYDHYVDSEVGGRCKDCGEDLLLDIHFVVTHKKATNSQYWDCECDKNYIHKRSESTECLVCGYCEEDMPDSHQTEINEGKHFAKY